MPLPPTPEPGQGKGRKASQPEQPTRVLRSRPQSSISRAETPTLRNSGEPQNPSSVTSVRENQLTGSSGNSKEKPRNPSSPQKIAQLAAQVISKHNVASQVKQALLEIIDLANKVEEEANQKIYVPINSVKTLHERFKADLSTVHKDLETKLAILHTGQNKIAQVSEALSKSTEALSSATNELGSKMLKVNDTTDKLANTTLSYRDTLLANPSNRTRSAADPKIFDDLDRKARQILVSYDTPAENALLNTPLLDLKDKANNFITEFEDPTRPESVRVESVTRTRNGSLLLLFNSKEAADWLREPEIEDKFLENFAVGVTH
jgi:hypothetical protein